MKTSCRTLLSANTIIVAMLSAAVAEESDDEPVSQTQLSFEAELEVGIETGLTADDTDTEDTEAFATLDLGIAFAISDRVSTFAELTFEGSLDTEAGNTFGDLSLYVAEIGIEVAADPVTLSFGKISPPFGSAWDTAPGYFGAEIAEDYELEEMLGVIGEVALGNGTLSASLFYADDTRLSGSWGTRRQRNSIADGGVANTGKLNNVALQYDLDFGATSLHAGALHLSRGITNERDHRGVAVGVAHGFDTGLSVMAEAARFTGWEGSANSATLATIGASFARGPWELSVVHAQQHIKDAPVHRMVALGVDYTFRSGVSVSSGILFAKEDTEKSEMFGISLVVPIGN